MPSVPAVLADVDIAPAPFVPAILDARLAIVNPAVLALAHYSYPFSDLSTLLAEPLFTTILRDSEFSVVRFISGRLSTCLTYDLDCVRAGYLSIAAPISRPFRRPLTRPRITPTGKQLCSSPYSRRHHSYPLYCVSFAVSLSRFHADDAHPDDSFTTTPPRLTRRTTGFQSSLLCRSTCSARMANASMGK